jgi:uncharacterized cupin superfamily protein
MTDPVNLFDLQAEDDEKLPECYRHRARRFGPSIGATKLGGAVYELDPGDSVYPYHYECVEEEWLVVLTGAPTLRDPEGEHVLTEGDLVAFPAGPDGAHKVTNHSDSVVRIVMLSTQPKNELSVCVYPDSGKVSVWPWPGRRLRITESLDYWDGEV